MTQENSSGLIRIVTPRHICGTCGEYSPHACAAVVEIRRLAHGRRTITITDREPGKEPEQEAEDG